MEQKFEKQNKSPYFCFLDQFECLLDDKNSLAEDHCLLWAII
jgi:hypothetical protein